MKAGNVRLRMLLLRFADQKRGETGGSGGDYEGSFEESSWSPEAVGVLCGVLWCWKWKPKGLRSEWKTLFTDKLKTGVYIGPQNININDVVAPRQLVGLEKFRCKTDEGRQMTLASAVLTYGYGTPRSQPQLPLPNLDWL